MSWSFSTSAANKAAAKRAVTRELPKVMLHQEAHAHDFDTVRNAINGAIDACAEGSISVSGCGSVSYVEWDGETKITNVSIQLNVYSSAS
jgi:hypothetical protein